MLQNQHDALDTLRIQYEQQSDAKQAVYYQEQLEMLDGIQSLYASKVATQQKNKAEPATTVPDTTPSNVASPVSQETLMLVAEKALLTKLGLKQGADIEETMKKLKDDTLSNEQKVVLLQ